mgnify:CR=1 FL=1
MIMFWQAQEVFRHGGANLTHPEETKYGHYRAKYRRFYLWWVVAEDSDKSRLHVAHVSDFDRWANSRAYEGPIPPTFADLNRLLTRLEGGATTRSTYIRSFLRRCRMVQHP